MKYTIYDPTTGQITCVLNTPDEDLAQLNIGDRPYVEGDFDSRQYYIQDGQVIEKDPNPSTDSAVYAFDYTTKTWQLDSVQTGNIVRQLRSQLLGSIDCINPVWYASLTSEQQQDLVVYRQQLLDVPQQSGFPETIEWPAKPTWL